MALNHYFWRRMPRREFAPHLTAMVEALEKRLLPGFDGIEQEAEAHFSGSLGAMRSMPATGDEIFPQHARPTEKDRRAATPFAGQQ
jgi:hypothetical protein